MEVEGPTSDVSLGVLNYRVEMFWPNSYKKLRVFIQANSLHFQPVSRCGNSSLRDRMGLLSRKLQPTDGKIVNNPV